MVTGLDHAWGGLCTPSTTPCPLPAGGAVGFRLGRYPPPPPLSWLMPHSPAR